MPVVKDEEGNIQEKPYTAEGIAAAEAISERSGEPVIRTYDAGGRVQKIMGYGKGGPNRAKKKVFSEEGRQHKEKKAQEKQRKAEPKAPKGRTKSKFKLSKKCLKDIKENPSMLLPSSPIKKKK